MGSDRTRPSETAGEHPAEPIEEDHRVLRGQLEALADAVNHTSVLSGLEALPKMLSEHFAQEEAVGGLYDDLARRHPPICKKIDALRNEHRAILEELERLRNEVDSHPGPEAALDQSTLRGVAHWVERLRRHEHVESKMIADVYYTDEGGTG